MSFLDSVMSFFQSSIQTAANGGGYGGSSYGGSSSGNLQSSGGAADPFASFMHSLLGAPLPANANGYWHETFEDESGTYCVESQVKPEEMAAALDLEDALPGKCTDDQQYAGQRWNLDGTKKMSITTKFYELK
mmetsp:Transcript_12310/g.41724  ORF Transcript_12310/g.41724 Transcript_12310/m.41724 type:complete len:133 (+) Transcript_12310:126-524(+)